MNGNIQDTGRAQNLLSPLAGGGGGTPSNAGGGAGTVPLNLFSVAEQRSISHIYTVPITKSGMYKLEANVNVVGTSGAGAEITETVTWDDGQGGGPDTHDNAYSNSLGPATLAFPNGMYNFAGPMFIEAGTNLVIAVALTGTITVFIAMTLVQYG